MKCPRANAGGDITPDADGRIDHPAMPLLVEIALRHDERHLRKNGNIHHGREVSLGPEAGIE